MAEFVQTMKDWKRMCISCQPNCEKCGLFEMGCDTANMMDEPDRAEKIIAKWAAEHPEPVYPTWAEFLHEAFCERYPMPYRGDTAWYAFLRETTIPADIAQRLGLQPKEM